MAPAEDEISTGELSRNIRDMRADLSEWRTDLTRTLSNFVTLQLYQSEMTSARAEMARIDQAARTEVARIEQAARTEIDELTGRLDGEVRKREQWRMAWITGIVFPIVVALIVGALVIQRAT